MPKKAPTKKLETRNKAQEKALQELETLSRDELLQVIFDRDVSRLTAREHAKYRTPTED